jgi:hypothetical protein
MKKTSIAAVIILLSMIGCTTLDHHWTSKPSAGRGAPWGRIIPKVDISNASLTNAVELLQQLANESGKPDITLHIAKTPDPSPLFTTLSEFGETLDDLNKPRPITLQLRNVSVWEALFVIAADANYVTFYKGNEAVLAPKVRNYGLVPITVGGSCRSLSTGSSVGKFSLVSTLRPMTCCDDEPTTTVHELQTREDGTFTLSLIVPGYVYIVAPDYVVSSHPKPQRISIIAIADDHYPTKFSVDLVESNLQYKVDIEMKQ